MFAIYRYENTKSLLLNSEIFWTNVSVQQCPSDRRLVNQTDNEKRKCTLEVLVYVCLLEKGMLYFDVSKIKVEFR